MWNTKTITLFIVKAITLLIVLLILSTQFDGEKKFTNFFKDIGNYCFREFGDGCMAFFNVKEQSLGLEVKLTSKKMIIEAKKTAQKQAPCEIISFDMRFAYLPFLLTLALVLAIPIHWKRKIIALPIAVILNILFTLFVIVIKIYYVYENTDYLPNITDSQLLKSLITVLDAGFKNNVGFLSIMPVFICLITCLRKSDFR